MAETRTIMAEIRPLPATPRPPVRPQTLSPPTTVASQAAGRHVRTSIDVDNVDCLEKLIQGWRSMPQAMHLYLDDSGTRHLDRGRENMPAHKHDWFGIGGVLLREADEPAVRADHAAFCAAWDITYPLHSAEIRASAQRFAWVKRLPAEQRDAFMHGIARLVTRPELVALACVIDRPGYNHRYKDTYGARRWSLCKTTFDVVVERAAKFARDAGCKLRVYIEKSDRITDEQLRGYYDELRGSGPPFNPATSSKYGPLTAAEFRETLYDFKPKEKSSPLMQLADLVLWPMCIGGYDVSNRAYVAMREAGTLIDCKLAAEAVPARGIKYSCWELVDAEKKVHPDVPGNAPRILRKK